MIDHLLQLRVDELRDLAAALRSGRVQPSYTSLTLQQVLPALQCQAIAGELAQLQSEGFTPAQLATVINAIVASQTAQPSLQHMLELVASGPQAPGGANRDTSVVVRDLFTHARDSVLVAGYAVHQGQMVFRALAERMDALPELRVRCFWDIPRPKGDTSANSEIIARFVYRFKTHQWPIGSRLPAVFCDPRSLAANREKAACLHAKCIVVDTRKVFISSANFTEAAQERNIELGVVVESPWLAGRVVQHFDGLLAINSLQAVL